MGMIYTIANQKGGVGKTTSTINLGAFLAHYGKNVLLVDIDPQSNATSSLGIDKLTVTGGTYQALLGEKNIREFILHNPKLKLSILPASPDLAGAEVELVNEVGRENLLKRKLLPLADDFDYILIDCPPSLGLLTLNGLVAGVDGILIPVQCEYLAMEGLGDLISTIDRVRRAISPDLVIRGVILTMYDTRTNLANDVVNEVKKHFQERVFNTIVPRNIRLAEAPSYGIPISLYSPSSVGAKAYHELAKEILIEDGHEIPEV
ncbi:MAG TPA: ParA family protein [Chloroflexi bacterium]|nr:MAG: ParA family protein [Chloroflexota bacterium]HDD55840.1 ParA family protein [Chloroflexota bacterium]